MSQVYNYFPRLRMKDRRGYCATDGCMVGASKQVSARWLSE
jgi:hypothetical protein